MRNDLFDTISVICDGEVKAPVFVYASLPEICGFVILLGPRDG
jgi:hypothetical protein